MAPECKAQRSEDLDAGVSGVDLERGVGVGGEGGVDVVDPAVEYAQKLEQPLLEQMRAKLDRAQDDVRAPVDGGGSLAFGLELLEVMGDEVAAEPVAVEHRPELGDDIGIACRRDPDVPLQAGHLCGVGEVRRPDVCRREA